MTKVEPRLHRDPKRLVDVAAMKRRYRCTCGYMVELSPRTIARGAVTYDTPLCARHPELGEMARIDTAVYEATHAGLDRFTRDHGPACTDMSCEHAHCRDVRRLYAMVQAAA